MTSFRFPAALKLKRSEDFTRVYDEGRRSGDPHLLLFALPRPGHETRAGFSVSRRLGNAVRRNRLKRLLREAFRLNRHDLPQGLDLVLIPRPREDSTLADYSLSLKTLAAKLQRQLAKNTPPANGRQQPPHDTPA